MRMSRREAGLHCWAMYGAIVCPTCGGSGIVTSLPWRERVRKGGVKSYLASLAPGVLSMKECGRLGGGTQAFLLRLNRTTGS